VLVRILQLAIVPLLLTAHGRSSTVRQPTPPERTAITTAVREAWGYESDVEAYVYARLHLRRRHVRPRVVSIRVSRRDPRFAVAAAELRDAHGRRRTGTAFLLLMRETRRATRWNELASATTKIPDACTRATPRALRDLLCPDPWRVLGYPRPATAEGALTVPSRAQSLRGLDWANTTLPGAVCGATQPIHLHHDVAFVRSTLYPWFPRIEVGAGDVAYGDVDGDGREEASVIVDCSNGGGTADGQLAFSAVVLTAKANAVHVLGLVTPRQPFDPAVPHVPLLRVELRRGEVISHEFWYGPHDGTCCQSGRATTVWRYVHGHLRPGRTVVTRKPR
jgi:hypothetical protein